MQPPDALLIDPKAALMTAPILVLLETAWNGTGERMPDWFVINPLNNSGRRLHKILEGREFVVGNSAPQPVVRATEHSAPDPAHVRRIIEGALATWPVPLLVLGGAVASRTFVQSGLQLTLPVLRIPHPAARMWSLPVLVRTQAEVREKLWTASRVKPITKEPMNEYLKHIISNGSPLTRDIFLQARDALKGHDDVVYTLTKLHTAELFRWCRPDTVVDWVDPDQLRKGVIAGCRVLFNWPSESKVATAFTPEEEDAYQRAAEVTGSGGSPTQETVITPIGPVARAIEKMDTQTYAVWMIGLQKQADLKEATDRRDECAFEGALAAAAELREFEDRYGMRMDKFNAAVMAC